MSWVSTKLHADPPGKVHLERSADGLGLRGCLSKVREPGHEAPVEAPDDSNLHQYNDDT